MDPAALRFAASVNFCHASRLPWHGYGPVDSRSIIFWEAFVSMRRQYRLHTGDNLETVMGSSRTAR